MATETRRYPARWLGVYRQDINSYYGGGHPIIVGGSRGYHTYIGFYSAMKDDVYTSKTPPRVYLSLFTRNAGEFDVGLHKQTSNKASGSLPFYRYAGIHPYISNGIRYKIEITNISGALSSFEGITSFKEALQSGYEGITLYGSTDQGEAYGATRDAYEVWIEVEGEWNTPPTKPVVTYPNGGETISGMDTVTWNASTDQEQPSSQLRYQVAVFDGTWHYHWASPGSNSLELDFSDYKESSVAKIAVRAFDSAIDYSHGDFGSWDYSDGVFRIAHNVAPTTPTNLSPANGKVLDLSEIHQLTWQHNDDDPQSRYSLRWRKQGDVSWNTVTRDSPNEYHYMSANTFPNGIIEWQTQTYDQQQLVSPWSSTSLFYAAVPSDKPSITSPADNSEVSSANPVVQWSSVDQQAYRVEVYNGTNLVWEIEKNSTNKAQTINYDLSNSTSYSIRLSVKNSDGLWSAYDEVDVITSFTPPEQASLSITVDEERGSLTIGLTNPEIAEVSVIGNTLYRRKAGEDEWYKLVDNIPSNFYYTDFSPASDITYQYYVQTWGDNGTYSESMLEEGSVSIKDTILSVAVDPDKWISFKWNPSKSFNYSFERKQMAFNKRAHPVSEFGIEEGLNMSVSFSIRSGDDVDAFASIANSKQTLLFRDSRGRKEYVTIDGYSVNDKQPNGYQITFNPDRVYFREGIL